MFHDLSFPFSFFRVFSWLEGKEDGKVKVGQFGGWSGFLWLLIVSLFRVFVIFAECIVRGYGIWSFLQIGLFRVFVI